MWTAQLKNWSTNPYHSRPKISEPITVVWQQSDLSCNTRASSFCSPENVGEQGIRLIIVWLINDGVKRKDPTSLPNVSDDLFLEPKQEKQQPNNTEPRTVHTNDLRPRCQKGNLLSTVPQPSLTPASIRSLDGGSAGLASVEMRSIYRLTFTPRANFQNDLTNSQRSSQAELIQNQRTTEKNCFGLPSRFLKQRQWQTFQPSRSEISEAATDRSSFEKLRCRTAKVADPAWTWPRLSKVSKEILPNHLENFHPWTPQHPASEPRRPGSVSEDSVGSTMSSVRATSLEPCSCQNKGCEHILPLRQQSKKSTTDLAP